MDAPTGSRPRFGLELALLVTSAPLAALLPFATGLGLAAAFVSGGAAWLFLARHKDAVRLGLVGGLLAWAAALSLATILLVAAFPERAAEVVPRGPAYWEEMRPWLMTGVGKEADPARFVPEHLLHVGAFLVLAAVSGGCLGLMLGAFLVGYMSYYIAQVVLLAESPFLAGLAAWHPWALVRVVAFVTLGVSVAQLVLARRAPRAWWLRERGFLLLGAALWVTDLAMKTLLAPHWWRLIRELGGIAPIS